MFSLEMWAAVTAVAGVIGAATSLVVAWWTRPWRNR